MKITYDRKLKDLQAEFNSHFPFLRIEFYQEPHQFGLASKSEGLLDTDLTVGMVNPKVRAGIISIHSDQKVGDFEQHFFDQFGLSLQVFRKSYGKWLQTWATDIWSLEEQNNRGKIMGDERA